MIGSQDSLNTANLKTVVFAIKKAVEEFLPILDQPKDPQYNKVQSETTEESELLAKQLTHSVEAEIENAAESGEFITPTSFEEKF